MWMEFVSRRLGSQEVASVRIGLKLASGFGVSRERTSLFALPESTVRSRLGQRHPPCYWPFRAPLVSRLLSIL